MSRAAPREAALPSWPALLNIDLACAYTCMSEDSFRFFARRYEVHPVDCAGLAVTRWRKTDLDAMIDRLPPKGAEMAPEATPANIDPADAALARAARRARG